MKAQDGCLAAVGAYDLAVILYGAAVSEVVVAPEDPFAWAAAASAAIEVDNTYAAMNEACSFF
jgi:hypothetical protein